MLIYLFKILNYIYIHFDFQGIILLLVLFYLLSFLSKKYCELAMRFVFFKYFAFIGIFWHEFSHYLMCKLTGANVSRFKVKLNYGYVIHQKPKVPFFGTMLISLAPFFSGLIFLTAVILLMTDISFDQLMFSLQKTGLANFLSLIVFVFLSIKLNWWLILYVYLFLNILISFVPSGQDIKNIAAGLIVYVIISGFVLWELNLLFVSIISVAIVFVICGIVILKIADTIRNLLHFSKLKNTI
ncbi:hypothetical protein C4569_00810 [Candidatus Parcubacteria bacterium]|nr:MAG: hypothetical protein C4569_00810 [Candidatus Parcubacteria bacterium]